VDLDETLSEADSWSDDELGRLERCPACGSAEIGGNLDHVPDHSRPGGRTWSFDRCGACASLFLNPRPHETTIQRAYMGSYYTHMDPPAEDSWPVTRGAKIRERLLKGYINHRYGYAMRPSSALGPFVVPLLPGVRGMGSIHVRDLTSQPTGGRLLDVGCGNGEFLVRMRAAGWSVAGIEPDPRARSHAVAAGLDVREGPSVAEAFPHEHFDAVTLNHVLEHLYDPLAVLKACTRAVRPGGTVWVAVPNATGLGLGRFGIHWYQLDPPRHIVLFTIGALRALFVEAGLEDISTPPPTLLATRWTYRASRAWKRGDADPLGAPLSSRTDAMAALAADARTLVQSRYGEELVMRARTPRS
jgi:2-polyprenyl-3-methyl-5-hydroxy-6-metoxy-1,4-benzoquinol methylase